MRKYILAVALITTGVVLLVMNYTTTNQTTYSDTVFLNESKVFDKNFESFLNSVTTNIKSLQQNFDRENKIKDSVFIKGHLFTFLEQDPYLISIVLVKNSTKLGIKKDGKSIILAIDSTKNLDIVQWQRFENNKLIGSWLESFEKEINKTAWYTDLKKTPNQIQWLLRARVNENKKDIISNELFYAGYFYHSEKSENLILLEFSRTDLLKKIDINPKIDYFSLLMQSNKNEWFDLTNLNSSNDSLKISKLKHFKKFENSIDGRFSFRFNDENYWNSFKRLPKETGLQFYLLTISENDLKVDKTIINLNTLNKLALFLILIGGFILLVKKRFFYRSSKRIKIPPVKEILLEDENRYLEFKSSLRWDYRQEKTNPELEKVILKTLAAFGNTDGGILLIGVDDDKNIIGLEKDFKTLKKSTADYYEIHLRNILHNMMGVKYVSKHIRMQFETCDNQHIICIIKVLAADEPIYLKFKNKNGQIDEKFFVRSGNSSQEIDSIAEINDYINTRFKK